MKTTLCDYCKKPMDETTGHRIILDPSKTATGEEIAIGHDMCRICFESPVILSETRRTRTRKPKPKIGRPRKAKVTTSTYTMPEEAMVTETISGGTK